ncbi:conserved hypothetical protein [Histoplasma capsulatum G186AR]|uniref:Protein kinase domain-containing protein n=2 Tax=Ajellomyces capsulatus TaxID=5037 RepID=C0NYB8_AJECG|nr:uncharacterized protein HCBG_07912 [Histoplasma capsulatum G186AR]EEH03786.1 conserved hypothetical protein [Histoplasma capsulatum G186AR]
MRGIWNFVSKTQLARNPLFQLRTMTHRDFGKPHEQELRTLLSNMRRDLQQAEEEKRQVEEKTRQLKIQMLPTSLPEFLDACHVHLSVSFSSRINHQTGTKGVPENAISKLRPDKIREWTTFPQEQSLVWKDLFATNFISEGHFTSFNTLRESGDELRQRSLGSEIDLVFYQRYAVEDRVSAVIRQLYSNQSLRNIFNLKGEIWFENHGNSLSTEYIYSGPGVRSPQQPPACRQREGVGRDGNARHLTPTVRSISCRPRADQFCVYNTGPGEKIPAYIVEYKAPHIFTKGVIEAGLMDMDVDKVIMYTRAGHGVKEARRTVAACISQTFSYMIQAGLEYGYLCTGETFIFLRVDPDDPTTVYYYLSVPNDDVGETTGWVSGTNCENRLHLTAIGQVMTFTLRALRTPPRDQAWRNHAEMVLKKWKVKHNDFVSDSENSSGKKLSEYKRNRPSRNEYIRMSPIKTWSKGPVANDSCRITEKTSTNWEISKNGSSVNGVYDSDSPSTRLPVRPSNIMVVVPPPKSAQGGGNTQTSVQREYCTQKCLLGLVNGDLLDRNCPNVASHGGGKRHDIDHHELLRLARSQILRNDGGPFGCESMHKHGISATSFDFTLFSHGYRCVAKGTPVEFGYSAYEEHVYQRLHSIQGTRIPVCLGSVDVSCRPLFYDGIARIGYLLLLSHAGTPTKFHDGPDIRPSFHKAVSDIHRLGVRHDDLHDGNVFWNAENKGAMVIDFERAKMLSKRGSTKETASKKKKPDVAAA